MEPRQILHGMLKWDPFELLDSQDLRYMMPTGKLEDLSYQLAEKLEGYISRNPMGIWSGMKLMVLPKPCMRPR